MLKVQHISVSIDCSPARVYEYASQPLNLPNWASGLSGSIEQVNGEWVAVSPMGKVRLSFASPNEFGVLDHEVITENGERFFNPLRVLPNQNGSEIVFTLYQTPGMSQEKFDADAQWIRTDLMKLKEILEASVRN